MKNIEQAIDQVNKLIAQYTWWKGRYDQASRMRRDHHKSQGRMNSAEMPPSFWQTGDRLLAEENEAWVAYSEAKEAIEYKLQEIKETVLADGNLQETLKAVAYLRSMPEGYESSESRECALEVARQGVRRFPTSLDLKEQLFDLVGTDEKITLLRESLQKSPQDTLLRQRLAEVLEKAGKTDELIALLRESLQKSPQDTLLRQRLAEVLEKAGRTDELIALLRESLQKSPNDTSLRQRLAEVLEKAGKTDALITLLRESLQESPRDTHLRQSLAEVLERTGKTDDLIAFLQEDLQESPGNLSLKQEIAQQLLKAKRVKEAVAFLDTELERTPQDNELRKYLSIFLIDALKNQQDSICLSAISLLQERKDEHAVEPLKILFVESQNASIRLKAIQALVNIQDNKSRYSLWNLDNKSRYSLWKGLADRAPQVRSYAAQALGEVGDASIVERLARALKAETDNTVREAIVNTLGKLDNRPRKWWEKMLNGRPWAK